MSEAPPVYLDLSDGSQVAIQPNAVIEIRRPNQELRQVDASQRLPQDIRRLLENQASRNQRSSFYRALKERRSRYTEPPSARGESSTRDRLGDNEQAARSVPSARRRSRQRSRSNVGDQHRAPAEATLPPPFASDLPSPRAADPPTQQTRSSNVRPSHAKDRPSEDFSLGYAIANSVTAYLSDRGDDFRFLANELARVSRENMDDLRQQDIDDPLDGVWDLSPEALLTGVGTSGLEVLEDILRLPEMISALMDQIPILIEKGQEVFAALSEHPELLQRFVERFPELLGRAGELAWEAITGEVSSLLDDAREAENEGLYRVAQANYIRAAGKALEFATILKAAVRLLPRVSRAAIGSLDELASSYGDLAARGRRRSRSADPAARRSTSPMDHRDLSADRVRYGEGPAHPQRSNMSPEIELELEQARQRVQPYLNIRAGQRESLIEFARDRRITQSEDLERLQEGLAEARRRRNASDLPNTPNSQFRFAMAERILSRPGHPLGFLINPNDGTLIHVRHGLGRYNHHQVISVDAGHLIDRIYGGTAFGIQDTAMNVLQGATGRTRRAVSIDGVPVELDTAIMFRELDLIDEDVFQRALANPVEGWTP